MLKTEVRFPPADRGAPDPAPMCAAMTCEGAARPHEMNPFTMLSTRAGAGYATRHTIFICS
jgi:hypothetical protein